MTDTLLKAIKRKWDADLPLIRKVTGGLHLSQIPEQVDEDRADLPYAYVSSGTSRYLYTLHEVYHEISAVEFVLFYANSGASLEEVVADLRRVFDWCELTYDDPRMESVYFQPVDSEVTCLPVKYRDGSMVYRASLRYESFTSVTHAPSYPPHPETCPA